VPDVTTWRPWVPESPNVSPRYNRRLGVMELSSERAQPGWRRGLGCRTSPTSPCSESTPTRSSPPPDGVRPHGDRSGRDEAASRSVVAVRDVGHPASRSSSNRWRRWRNGRRPTMAGGRGWPPTPTPSGGPSGQRSVGSGRRPRRGSSPASSPRRGSSRRGRRRVGTAPAELLVCFIAPPKRVCRRSR